MTMKNMTFCELPKHIVLIYSVKKHSTFVFSGIFSYIVYWNVLLNNDIFFYVWAIFPTFSLMEGISNVYVQTKEVVYCDQACEEEDDCDKNNICSTLPQCCRKYMIRWRIDLLHAVG